MEVCEQNEAYVEKDGELTFSHTKVILRKDGQYYYATTHRRYDSAADIDLAELPLESIPTWQIWPPFPHNFTHAPEASLRSCHIKEPSLIHYGDTKASTDMARLLLDEAEVCEALRTHPHPNIAQYLGCRVIDGRITGLCFVKYGVNLFQWVKEGHACDIDGCIKGIKDGIKHLHDLGFVHCDVNPTNIVMNGDAPVIIDFDSCRRIGEPLGLKAGTRGWTREDFTSAQQEVDDDGVLRIQHWLIQTKRM
ncbi:similar to serine/threonine-protein kinase [Plenodomus lingam JN3]|uniref:Similar to serine/threonine-protein kinase n=1 Tax=Leptosphaeria maculans (strain JN3 / isolate v23.1.3 / race Av1-4-5-6-7-8) TaxID=985895 RepID=E5AAY5_LEPMJ|nr:similar to serine/threonine-protein kinase [Plenodomus lingam JN3]CBY00826.1 similar to serine/threonine-protein kinase [Plenodomus lingam JN3]